MNSLTLQVQTVTTLKDNLILRMLVQMLSHIFCAM